MITSAILGAAIGHGARDRRTEHGPPYLLSWGLLDQLAERNVRVSAAQVIQPAYRAPRATPKEIVAELCTRLASEVAQVLKVGQFPIVLGGDHSCAIGTWSGVSLALNRKPFGLIWVDAHCDSHTPDTSESGAIHGMPLAALLGHGEARFTKIAHPARKLLPEHTILIGIRSYEAGEMALLRQLGIQIFDMAQVAAKGFGEVMREAQVTLLQKVDRFGITVDLDAMDPLDAPGVGSPEAGGISAAELITALETLRGHPQLLACEITEYNPFLDVEHRTAQIVRDCIVALRAEVTPG